jgi:hypothetical protein
MAKPVKSTGELPVNDSLVITGPASKRGNVHSKTAEGYPRSSVWMAMDGVKVSNPCPTTGKQNTMLMNKHREINLLFRVIVSSHIAFSIQKWNGDEIGLLARFLVESE